MGPWVPSTDLNVPTRSGLSFSDLHMVPLRSPSHGSRLCVSLQWDGTSRHPVTVTFSGRRGRVRKVLVPRRKSGNEVSPLRLWFNTTYRFIGVIIGNNRTEGRGWDLLVSVSSHHSSPHPHVRRLRPSAGTGVSAKATIVVEAYVS